MERHFEKDLNEMKERLLWMGSLAERAVHQAVHAVLDSDEQLAKRVLDEEDAINELQIEIDDRVVQLLALHQLMAVDLRFVLAVSRINNDLERIGDQAVNIAQGALRILRHPRVKPYVDLPRMSEACRRDGPRCPERRRSPRRRARAKRPRHATIRSTIYRDQIFRELLTYMMGDSSVVFPAFELILVAKNLERIGDHATNIAEDVIYIVAGPGRPPPRRRPPLSSTDTRCLYTLKCPSAAAYRARASTTRDGGPSGPWLPREYKRQGDNGAHDAEQPAHGSIPGPDESSTHSRFARGQFQNHLARVCSAFGNNQ